MNDKTKGLYKKYDVKRLNDADGKHDKCHYFVLDLVHDKFSAPALRTYAMACRDEYPALFKELIRIAAELEQALLKADA